MSVDDRGRFAVGTGAPVTPPRSGENFRTLQASKHGAFAREPLPGMLALGRYERYVREALAAGREDAVLVALVDGAGGLVCTAVLVPGQSVVVGRHSQADLHVTDPDVALRHLALAVAPASTAEAPLLRIWDLETGKPFRLPGHEAASAVTATGPVFASLGGYHLAAIPLGSLPRPVPLGTRALWEAIPQPAVLSRVAHPGDIIAAPVDGEATGRTTLIPGPGAAGVPELPNGPVLGDIEVSALGQTCSFSLGSDDLERGVLIGAYARCLPVAAPPALSRVHLLIARLGPDIVAIDTASTYGSATIDAGHFLLTSLGDEATLTLAGVVRVAWRACPRHLA